MGNKISINSQSGSVFTLLLAGVAMAAAISYVLYQTMSGPISSMVRVSDRVTAKSQSQSVSNIVISDAVNNAGDCDADGTVEPRPWRAAGGPAGSFPPGGGLLPNNIGAPLADQWGTEYGYCAWDAGSSVKVAGCDGGGANARRRSGVTPTVNTGTPVTQTIIAIISAGPDRNFDTSCRDYNVDGVTDVIFATVGGAGGAGEDDIVQRYRYNDLKEASSPTLWTLKTADPATAVINKNLEVGPEGAPTFSVTAATGATTVNGLLTATGGSVRIGYYTNGMLIGEIQDAACTVGTGGLLRYNTILKSIQMCDASVPAFVDMPINALDDAVADNTKYNLFMGLSAGAQGVCPGGVCPGPWMGAFGNNTGVGVRAMLNTTTGSNNTGFGYEALYGNQDGSDNTAFGFSAGPATASLSNTTAIGASTYALASNTWVIGKLGTKQAISEGADAAMGVATLSGGTVTVANALVTADSRIFLTNNEPHGTVGGLYISARNPGFDFTISSTDPADDSVIAWEIKEPNCMPGPVCF